MILKVIKRNKEERILDYFIDNNKELNHEIKKSDTIYFTCDICGENASSRLGRIEDNQFLCKFCKAKKTKLKKYGDPNYNNRKKFSETMSEKDVNEINEKRKQTNLIKYGGVSPASSEEVIKKIKQTKLEKYGDENYINRNKAEQTNLIKYGGVSPASSEEVREKIKQTNLERYGVEYSYQNKKIFEKLKQTKLERYGDEKYNNSLKMVEVRTKNNFDKMKFHSLWFVEPLFDIEMYQGRHYTKKYPFLCKICGSVFSDDIYSGTRPICPKCNIKNRSKGEIELASFLKQYVEIIENDRELIKPKEIDILIPSLNIAIEYNGEFWHTDIEKEENKKLLVEEKDYTYIVIWEKDWNNNKEDIKNMLLEKLSLSV